MSDKTSLLFVDDDPKAGDLLLRFCEGSAYDCHVFRDARKALDYFCAEGADLIISDLRMPGMNGIELLAEIRERDTEIPVIIVTAHSSLDSAIDALRSRQAIASLGRSKRQNASHLGVVIVSQAPGPKP